MAAGHLSEGFCAFIGRKVDHRIPEDVLTEARKKNQSVDVDPVPVFSGRLKAHLRQKNISLCEIDRRLEDDFGLGYNKTYSLSRLVAGGRIFVPCIPQENVILGFDHLGFTVSFFENGKVNASQVRSWSRIMPVSGGEGYVQPVYLSDVLERLD